jgi:hypothetical protein
VGTVRCGSVPDTPLPRQFGADFAHCGAGNDVRDTNGVILEFVAKGGVHGVNSAGSQCRAALQEIGER